MSRNRRLSRVRSWRTADAGPQRETSIFVDLTLRLRGEIGRLRVQRFLLQPQSPGPVARASLRAAIALPAPPPALMSAPPARSWAWARRSAVVRRDRCPSRAPRGEAAAVKHEPLASVIDLTRMPHERGEVLERQNIVHRPDQADAANGVRGYAQTEATARRPAPEGLIPGRAAAAGGDRGSTVCSRFRSGRFAVTSPHRRNGLAAPPGIASGGI